VGERKKMVLRDSIELSTPAFLGRQKNENNQQHRKRKA
jgi:hypothetical protein